MADIIYTRDFTHDDWIDNEDVVQAGGEKGFNAKFHEIEVEFDNLSAVVRQIVTELQKVKQLTLIKAFTIRTLAHGATHQETIDDYANDEVSPDTRKVYFPTIVQADPLDPKPTSHFFNYKVSPTRTVVDLYIKNEHATDAVTLTVRVFTLI